MGDSKQAFEDQRFFYDEDLSGAKEKTTTLSEKVKILILTDKTLTTKQIKRLDAFYLELKSENL